eukprot:2625568-Prymnesium_polylepis.2
MESSDDEGEPYFRVDGVRCRAENSSRVRIGMQLSSRQRAVVKIRVGETRADAVARSDKFAAVRALIAEQASEDTLGGDEKLKDAETATSGLDPSTQSMDMDELDGRQRPDSPPTRTDLDDAFCMICEEDDVESAFDLPGGRFCCASCFDSNVGDELIQEAAAQQLAARRAAASQPAPELPELQPRRSARPSKPVAQLYNLDRSGPGQPGWSAYELARSGSRHDRSRDESYAELQAGRDRLRAEVDVARRECGELTSRLDGAFSRLRNLALGDMGAL